MAGYTILAEPVFFETEEKRSEFLTFLHPVDNREAAINWVETYRQRYPDANHVCWAYVIGNTRQPQTQAFSDDGEPSGTAGKPMLHVLTEREVGNALAVVVRYFGGVKLGAGGLVRAYSGAVSDAVNVAKLVPVIPKVQLLIELPFSREAKLRHLIDYAQGVILNVDYQAFVTITCELPATEAQNFRIRAVEETAGDAQIKSLD